MNGFSVVRAELPRPYGMGLSTRTKDFIASCGWADVVVFDSNDFDLPNEAEKLRKSGKSVFGSSDWGAKLRARTDHVRRYYLQQKAGIEIYQSS